MAESNERRPAHAARRQAIRRRARQQHGRFYQRIAHWSVTRHGAASPVNWRREHWILAGTAALLVLITAIVIPTWASAMGTPAHEPEARSQVALPTPPPPPVAVVKAPPKPAWHVVTVTPGQTLSDIFQSQGLGFTELQRVLDAAKHADALRHIHPGDRFAFQTGPDGSFKAIRFDLDEAHRVVLRADGGHLQRLVQTRDIEHRQQVVHGMIESSLFGAAAKAGISDGMIVKLADVFKYDIDFAREVRSGDQFTVVYDKVYRDGSFLRDGHIIAAEFYNQGKRYTAYRFKKPDGSYAYYSEDGRPLQKALLRTPLKFTRISSRFGMRMDPVLHSRHLHAGVDLAAPTGTPIHAAGNGVISIRGWVRGYGRYIRIRNTPAYSTGYGHMSRFAPGLHVGSRVHQGQVIGYVGQTGWATGPHLHYEVRIHGRPVNPLTVTMPKPKPLAPKLLARFKQHIQPMLARIQAADHRAQLARAGDNALHAD